MKALFKSYKKLNDDELKELWGNSIFIFDTNVLHSLYRYQSSTSSALLGLMDKLKERIWIPHHVGLEFHRNRLSVIHDQHKKFADTKNAVNDSIVNIKKEFEKLQLKKRHSLIDPDKLISGIEAVTSEYLEELDTLEANSLKIGSDDAILEKLETLFDGKVGAKPTQEEINEIETSGKKRYEDKIPPGYRDDSKSDKFQYCGVEYQRKFGDLIVWKQLIKYVAESGLSHVIFVTDDNKEDWWQITKGRVTGFRTELTDELYAETDVKLFNAYSLGGFLHHSNLYLGGKSVVSEDAIDEVEDNVQITVDDELYAHTKSMTKDVLSELIRNATDKLIVDYELNSKSDGVELQSDEEVNQAIYVEFYKPQEEFAYKYYVKVIENQALNELKYDIYPKLSNNLYQGYYVDLYQITKEKLKNIINIINNSILVSNIDVLGSS